MGAGAPPYGFLLHGLTPTGRERAFRPEAHAATGRSRLVPEGTGASEGDMIAQTGDPHVYHAATS